jgi:hypothetical protein
MCLLLERRKKVVIYDRDLLHPQLVLDEQGYRRSPSIKSIGRYPGEIFAARFAA